MTQALPDFSKAKILVIGDIMLDRYWSGSTSRISPEAPVPVVRIGDTENRLGGGANVAKNLSVLGCEVKLSGIIGNDEAGKEIKNLLIDSGISSELHIKENFKTITKLRIISQHQQLIRLDFEEAYSQSEKPYFEKAAEDLVKDNDLVIISDYAKGTVEHCQPIIKACNQNNITVLVDPKGSNFKRYSGASLLTPNLSELEAITGKTNSLEEVFEKASELCSELNIESILVTLSEKGMVLVSPTQPPFHIPTQAKEVFDVTGAGDTVIACLAASIAVGTDKQSAMRIANAAAGVAVGKIGTATVTQEEIISALGDHIHKLKTGAISLEELKKQLPLCRSEGEKIVFTNGCFDILHAGHVRYLKQAAKLGDRLIVGLNSDNSIKILKGEKRPIVPLEERMEILASLRCVDWVVSFEEETPINLISNLLPDYLAKGGDYIAEEIVGHKEVTKNGGKVIIMPFVDGCSTTSIIEKIKESS